VSVVRFRRFVLAPTLKHPLDFCGADTILKHVLQHSSLDQVFHALADPTRRAIVERLAQGHASVSELAAPFAVSLTAVGQHVQVLEASGLVRTSKVGRVRTVELQPRVLSDAERWFADHRARWETRLDRLGALLDEEDEDERRKAPAKGPRRKP
jgi:DNA-binding transcriptional ArsR family regulator